MMKVARTWEIEIPAGSDSNEGRLWQHRRPVSFV